MKVTYFNNILNIRTGQNWRGLIGSDHGFCEFSHPKYAVRAAAYLLFKTYTKKYHDKTLCDIIFRYAPPGDGNNSNAYVAYVMNKTSIDRYALVSSFTPYQRFEIIKAMAMMETGFHIPEHYYYSYHNYFTLNF